MSQTPNPPTTNVAAVAAAAADNNNADNKPRDNVAVDNTNDSDSTASEAPKPSPLPTPPIPNARAILMCEQAQDASTQEHQMTIRQSISIYKPAIWICVFWSASVIMQSFNITLIPSFFAQEQFSEKFGVLSSEGKYEISAGWRTGLTVGALIGEMIGLVLSGIIAEKYGYRKTMIGALIATTGFIFIPFFATSIEALLVGQILGGIPWGMFQSLPSSYASDIMPQVLRPYLTTYINLCWVFGQLIASIAVRAVLQLDNEWAYRIPFAIQWIWPPFIILAILFSPESPAWLVRKDRRDAARGSMLRLTSRKSPTFNVDNVIMLMAETNEREKRMSSGISYWDCFKGVDWRRTRIACLTWLVQCLCGSVLMGYSPVVYKACGLDGDWAFNMTIIQYCINIVGAVLAWWFMHLSGRRSLYLYGCMALLLLLISIGSTAFISSANKRAQWGMAIQYLLYTFVYGCTIGPVCFSLITEMSSMRLKTKTIVLARITYNIGSIIVNNIANFQLTPKPTGWGWGAKSALFWAGSTFLCIVWIYLEMPEPKGRTYCDMDIMFEHKISARKFSKTNVAELASRPEENAEAENNGTELGNMDGRTNP